MHTHGCSQPPLDNAPNQEWVDERLQWEPEKFGNLSDIIVKADKLWLPELAVMNGWVLHYAGRCHGYRGDIADS